VTLEHPGTYSKLPSAEALYQTEQSPAAPAGDFTVLTLIPYYAWANGEDSSMQVWIPYIHA
jgi:DUF1680 family protein